MRVAQVSRFGMHGSSFWGDDAGALRSLRDIMRDLLDGSVASCVGGFSLSGDFPPSLEDASRGRIAYTVH